MSMWKRNAVVATVVLFVCVALYLSWSYNRGDDPDKDANGNPVYSNIDKTLNPSGQVGATATPSSKPAANVSPSGTPSAEDAFFTDQRVSRQKARDSALSILKDLAAQDNLTAEQATKTNAEITALAEQALTEARIEGLVVAKGFKDCVAILNSNGISVVVAPPSGGLTATDVVKIQDVVVSETKIGMENIRVQEASIG
ncbi:hypothetical protein FACS1894217_06040 [Clostridia bacterium]|nr:hypothetical protein FACS1894217_06040 [Clostridia bacterium]